MKRMRLTWPEALVCFLAVGCGGPEMDMEMEPEAQQPGQHLTQDIIHRPPEVPMTLDGVAAAPESVTQYNGKPLYYIPTPDGKQLHVFTTEARLQSFIHDNLEAYGMKKSEGVSSLYTSADNFLFIYEHDNFEGSSYLFGQRSHYGSGGPAAIGDTPDLRQVGCVFFWCQNWDDKISSLRVYTIKAYTVLHEHPNFQGSQLLLFTNNEYWRLSPYGWNDRATSISLSWANGDPVEPQ